MTKIPKPPPIPNPPKPLFTEIGGGFDKWDVAIVIVPIALTSLAIVAAVLSKLAG